MSSLHLKIFMGTDVRRRTLLPPLTYEAMRAAVLSVGAPLSAKIYFVDDDADLVLVESDAEFLEARRCAPVPDTLHVGVGHDGAAALAAASRKHLAASTPVPVPVPAPVPVPVRPTASVSAPATPASAPAPPAASPAPAASGLKQMVEAAVQEALRSTIPHLQASMRSVEDAERRRVAELEQQLSEIKLQMSESFSAAQPASATRRADAGSAKKTDDQLLQEALRVSRLEAEQQEAKRLSAQQAAETAAAAAAARTVPAPAMFESLFVGANTEVQFGELIAAITTQSGGGAAQFVPAVKRFLQRPNDDAVVDELVDALCNAYKAAAGSRARDARGAVQHAVRYVRQRPHVREFLTDVLNVMPIDSLLAAFAAMNGNRPNADDAARAAALASLSAVISAPPVEAKPASKPAEGVLVDVSPPAVAAVVPAPVAAAVVPAPVAAAMEASKSPQPQPQPQATPSESDASRVRGYRASLVRDVTLPDGARVRANASLTKVWRLQNSGSAPWPNGATLGFVGGSDFSAVPTAIPDGVEPGAVVDITLRCTAPARAGRYVGYWRLIDPRGAPFGERIWLDVDVVTESSVDTPVPVPVPVPAPAAVAEPQAASADDADGDSWTALAAKLEESKHANERLQRMQREAVAEAERKALAAQRDAEARALRLAAEKEAAAAAAIKAADEKLAAQLAKDSAVERQYADKLRQLAAMGFTGERTKQLIVKHQGNVLAVVQELLEDNN
jgi:hypothetical protein